MNQAVGCLHAETYVGNGGLARPATLIACVADIHVVEVPTTFGKRRVDSTIMITVIREVAVHRLGVGSGIHHRDHRLAIGAEPAANVLEWDRDTSAPSRSHG